MTKILPIKQPIVTSYPGIAATMSVLATDDRFKPWICSNYNNIVYTRYDDMEMEPWGDFHDIHYPKYGMLFEKIPFIEFNTFYKHLLNIMCDNITKFVVNCIKNNYYIFIPLNNYYIPHSHAFKKFTFYHPTFVYGYDCEKEIIYIADFYCGKKYDYYTISFEEFTNSYVDSMDDKAYSQIMYTFRINENFDISKLDIDKKILKTGLEDFVNSTDNIVEVIKTNHYNGGTPHFGLSYYDKLIEDITAGKANVQAFHVICDHASLMNFKVSFLYNKSLIDKDLFKILKKKSDIICDRAIICRNSFIKRSSCNITMDDAYIQQIRMLKLLDEEFINLLLREIIVL